MLKGKFLSKLKQIGAGATVLSLILLTACGGGGGAAGSDKAKDSSPSPGDASNVTIKVGVIMSFSGPFAALSNDIKEGIDLYLEQNKQMLGKNKVEVKYEDDEGNPQVGLRKYRQLVSSEKINLLIAPLLSNVAYALRDEVEKDKMITIVPNAAANDISWAQKSDYIYRVSLSNWQGGHNAGAYIAQNIGKKAITVANDYSAGKEHISAFKAAFEAAGGKVVKEIYSKIGTNDYGPYVTEIAKEKPEVVYSFLGGNEGIRLIQQYSDFGLKGQIPLTGSPEFGDMQIITATGDAAEGIVSGVFYTPWLENDENKKFAEAYQKKYNKLPNMFSVAGFDSAKVLDKAVSETGNLKTEDLIKVLKGISWDSPRGAVTLDPKTNNVIQDFYIVKNTKKDNQVVPVTIQKIDKVTMPETAPAK